MGQTLCVMLYVNLSISNSRKQNRVKFKSLDSIVLFFILQHFFFFSFCYILTIVEASISNYVLSWSGMLYKDNFREIQDF